MQCLAETTSYMDCCRVTSLPGGNKMERLSAAHSFPLVADGCIRTLRTVLDFQSMSADQYSLAPREDFHAADARRLSIDIGAQGEPLKIPPTRQRGGKPPPL
eukprot:scpid20323/ scgid27452/ 